MATSRPVRFPEKRGRIAVITTPKFRETHPGAIDRFVFENLYTLTSAFEVLTTGTTLEFILNVIQRPLDQVNVSLISKDMGLDVRTEDDLGRWRETIDRGLRPTLPSFPGMIEIIHELVEQRLDAVIHLTDWQDLSAKPDSAVLWRQANVHNVPIAHDPTTAQAYIAAWSARLTTIPQDQPVFPPRQPLQPSPLARIVQGDRVLGLIAHDAMKLEMCRFAVEKAPDIFKSFDYILATGTTGRWIQRFMQAAGRSSQEVERIRCCLSGPYGGDVQIAYAVVQQLCRKIVFLQDPQMSHPHDVDIRLFEQAVVASNVDVELATNAQSAELIIRRE